MNFKNHTLNIKAKVFSVDEVIKVKVCVQSTETTTRQQKTDKNTPKFKQNLTTKIMFVFLL